MGQRVNSHFVKEKKPKKTGKAYLNIAFGGSAMPILKGGIV